MNRPRINGGVAFDPDERAALDKVPATKSVACWNCGRITIFGRGILGDWVVYSCRNHCGAVSFTTIRVEPTAPGGTG